MLTEALHESMMFSNVNTIYSLLLKDFKIEVRGDKYHIDLYEYIHKLLTYNNEEYILPTNPWHILDDYYKIFNKVYISDLYDDTYDVISFASGEFTKNLIEMINVQYPLTYLITDEMRNI